METTPMPPQPPRFTSAPPPPVAVAAAAPQKTSGLSIWSMALGIAGLVLCLGPVTCIPAIICGHMALSRIRAATGTLGGHGMAIAGLATGYAGTLLSLVMIPVIVMAIPAYTRASESFKDSLLESQAHILVGACHLYAAENDGRAPDDVGQLVEGGFIEADMLNAMGSLGVDMMAFQMVYSGKLSECPNAHESVLLRGPTTQDGTRRVLAYVDGHVTLEPVDAMP